MAFLETVSKQFAWTFFVVDLPASSGKNDGAIIFTKKPL
jgi:hypothetical protein